LPLPDQARADLGRIRRLEVDRNIAGLIAELGSDADHGRYLIIRSYAADALGRLGDVRAVPYLAELAHDPKDIVRSSAVGALSRLRSKDAAPVFGVGLHDPAETVRMASAEGLGRLGDPAAIPMLRAVLDTDLHAEVRMVAAEALVELGDDNVCARIPEVMRAVSWRVRGHPRWKRLSELGTP
jgi:HEAT repeat protein